MDPRSRHQTLHKLGYRQLLFPYIQPCLELKQKPFEDLYITVHESCLGGLQKIRAAALMDFIEEFCESVRGMNNKNYENERFYRLMRSFSLLTPFVRVYHGFPFQPISRIRIEDGERLYEEPGAIGEG